MNFKKEYLWIIGMFFVAGALFFVVSGYKIQGYAVLNNFEKEIFIYKSASCGCCSVYGNYFQSKGNINTKVITSDNVDSLKLKYGVPLELQSCHTTIVGDYFVEGHIPLEAVDKLLEESPKIAGIAMPGMPQGSPGMPGIKKSDFVIYAVNYDGTYEEFMRL